MNSAGVVDGASVNSGAVTSGAGREIGGAGTSGAATGDTGREIGGAPWHAGLTTGIGSMPGTDPNEAAALIAGELPELPHLPELPARGVGADMIGRTLGLCTDMPAEVTSSGWRLASHPGSEIRCAYDYLSWDLDAVEQRFAGAEWVKVQATGPWTLAAEVETSRGHRVLTDHGAVSDLAASLADGLSEHLAQLARRLPGTRFVVQIDEPSLPNVLAGRLPTASGLSVIPAVPAARASELLTGLVESLAGRPTVAHCCDRRIPVSLLRGCGFDALSFDLTDINDAAINNKASRGTASRGPTKGDTAISDTASKDYASRMDAIGEAVEAGIVLMAGLVPPDVASGGASDRASGTTSGRASRMARDMEPGQTPRREARREPRHGAPTVEFDHHSVAEPLLELWHRLGLPDARLQQVVVTPTCGLAAATMGEARRALTLARDGGRVIADRALR